MEWQPSTPLSAEELARLPVFPLPRVVFFPGTALPLHLFEPRYTEMIEDCLDNGCTAMAVALLAPGWEDHYDGDPAIYEIAGAGRIVAHQRQPDGTHDVILHGLDRVRLHEFPNETGSVSTSSRTKATPIAAPVPSPSRILARRRLPTSLP
ncbi:MAG: LON peptidase substrate-binding domain-containing protein [Deltaproteobacteria bacterium]|nr:LON peptidase substrate-binding domain-containing protein [Deltaproteobacteria bacterium]